MEVNQSIFKSYDIRGVYPKELNEEAAYLIGAGIAKYTNTKRIAVGRDMRLSSPGLFKSLAKGLINSGCDVYDLGEIPVEAIYFAVSNSDKYGAGVMITASHNPKDYNGFKVIKKQGRGFLMLRGTDLAGSTGERPAAEIKGRMKKIDILPDYLNYIFSFFDVKKIKHFKVVVDAGNGMAGKVIPLIEKKLKLKITALNFKLDGNFPSHPSNVFEPGATDQICREVKEKKADLGFIFDGDADRIYLIDELGNFVRADLSLLLMAEQLLKNNPGGIIAYNLICSKAVPEFISKWGGKPIRTKVGFVNVQEALIKNNGLAGGELSGHFCFRDNFYGDSAVMALLTLLSAVSVKNKTLSEIISGFSLYAKTAETNFEVQNKNATLEKIKEKYSDGRQDYLDGVTVEYKDWWFNVRASQTEPLLRLTIEANSEKLLEEKKKELSALISQ